jgi:hypothetical protein
MIGEFSPKVFALNSHLVFRLNVMVGGFGAEMWAWSVTERWNVGFIHSPRQVASPEVVFSVSAVFSIT